MVVKVLSSSELIGDRWPVKSRLLKLSKALSILMLLGRC